MSPGRAIRAKESFHLLFNRIDPLGQREDPTAAQLQLIEPALDPVGPSAKHFTSYAARADRLHQILFQCGNEKGRERSARGFLNALVDASSQKDQSISLRRANVGGQGFR